MKKILMTLALAVIASSSFAQDETFALKAKHMSCGRDTQSHEECIQILAHDLAYAADLYKNKPSTQTRFDMDAASNTLIGAVAVSDLSPDLASEIDSLLKIVAKDIMAGDVVLGIRNGVAASK